MRYKGCKAGRKAPKVKLPMALILMPWWKSLTNTFSRPNRRQPRRPKGVKAMQVATAQEALFMACEMESSAIQLYTRALSLMEQLGRQDEPLYDLSLIHI